MVFVNGTEYLKDQMSDPFRALVEVIQKCVLQHKGIRNFHVESFNNSTLKCKCEIEASDGTIFVIDVDEGNLEKRR